MLQQPTLDNRLTVHQDGTIAITRVGSIAVAGLTIEETARALDVATGTVKQDWSFARAWLLG